MEDEGKREWKEKGIKRTRRKEGVKGNGIKGMTKEGRSGRRRDTRNDEGRKEWKETG